VLSHVAGVT